MDTGKEDNEKINEHKYQDKIKKYRYTKQPQD